MTSQKTPNGRNIPLSGRVVSWNAMIVQSEPHDLRASSQGGQVAYPFTTMLCIHLLQHWSALSDSAMEEALVAVF